MATPQPQPEGSSRATESMVSAYDDVRQFEPRKVDVGRRETMPAPGVHPHVPPTPLFPASPATSQQPLPDVEDLQRKAFQHGYEEGERSGVERGAAQYREAVAAFGRSALEVATLKPRLRAETERELVDLAFSIARRILRRESSVDPDAVVGLVRSCLEQYDRADIRKLQVHPQDYAAITAFFQQNPAPPLEIVSDPKVSRGGAIYQTAQGTLDARFEAQLEEIEKGLTDR